jgi:glyoxylase-like metal-dependent hydrolase (beta-lactamase superfamily II)
MKILEEAGVAVYMVGGGGMGVSHQTDSHTYLLHSHGELALIDAGSGIKPELILENLQRDGIELRRISTILITHSHWDHARGVSFGLMCI